LTAQQFAMTRDAIPLELLANTIYVCAI